jgi:hypothetical protein
VNYTFSFKLKKNKSSEEIDSKLDLKKNDVNNGQKAKPNKELLEKLKEEMRKLIKKPQSSSESEQSIDNVVIAAIKNNSNNEQNLVHDSILTIPPLYLSNNNEFQLSSDTFLMNSNPKIENENLKDEDDGKILFTSIRNDESNKVETLRFDKNLAVINDKKNNKRKLSENDSDEDDASEEEDDDDDDDDDDEEEEENETDENISSEDSDNSDFGSKSTSAK